jgi:ketosteroid isomerase-like protein
MEVDEEALAPEPERRGASGLTEQGGSGGPPADWLGRATSALLDAAVSMTLWEIGTTLRLARLATDFAFHAPADLVGRAGRMVRREGGAPSNLQEEANRALVLRLYRAALQADLPTARKLFDENVSWHVPAPEPAAGSYRGVAETVPVLSAVWGGLGTVEAVELRDVVASEERAAALLRLSVVRSGRRATLDRWLIFRIDGGQVTQAWGPFSTEPRL